MTGKVGGTERLILNQDDLNRKVRRVALAIPALALPVGAAVMVREPQWGLFATAFILGWTQLVGL